MKLLRILIASVLTVSPCWAQDLSKVPPANYDESKIKPYTLPDPLVFNDGRKVGSAKEWPARRSELLETVTREMFGRIPNESVEISADTPQIKTDALGGLAKRKLVTLHLKRNGKDIPVDLLIS